MTFANNQKTKLDKYIIQIVTGGDNLDAFKINIEQLDKMYDDISIVIISDGNVIYGSEKNIEADLKTYAPSVKEEPQKKSFFAKLFGKK